MNIQVALFVFTVSLLYVTSLTEGSRISEGFKHYSEEVLKDEAAKAISSKGFPKRSLDSEIGMDNIYDDEHQSVPSHEKAYFDSGPELNDIQVLKLRADDDFVDEDISNQFFPYAYRGH